MIIFTLFGCSIAFLSLNLRRLLHTLSFELSVFPFKLVSEGQASMVFALLYSWIINQCVVFYLICFKERYQLLQENGRVIDHFLQMRTVQQLERKIPY